MKNDVITVSKIAVASDHAGYKLKNDIIGVLKGKGIEILDLGADSEESVDYPDYGLALANSIITGKVDKGIAICGTGIGISIAINRHIGVRAALCNDSDSVILARKHNNANVLAMGARSINTDTAKDCLEAFLCTSFEGNRHERRVSKLDAKRVCSEIEDKNKKDYNNFNETLNKAIEDERDRQENSVELIASENFVSKNILKLQGSILTNKYAEGYPNKRYYGGCKFVDIVEDLARDGAKKLFNCNWVNVQPNSGSQANQAVFLALLSPGDTILGMSLSSGGHLTHGAKPNQSGKNYKSIQYGVRKEDGLINYKEVEILALEYKPKLIIAGASAYSKIIDFERFRKIADRVGAYLLVDMAHYSGLIAAGCYPSPINHAHVCTSTTHKTLRGPRGGIIVGNDKDIGKMIDKAVFPGLQGGPLMHVIAAKGAAFNEALTNDFKIYSNQTIKNAQAMANRLKNKGFEIVSGGTDCHMVLVDLRPKGINGKEAEMILDNAGITCNKNSIPFDNESPFITSGIRLGSAAGTTRGFKEKEFIMIADYIDEVITNYTLKNQNTSIIENKIKAMVTDLCKRFPLYKSMI